MNHKLLYMHQQKKEQGFTLTELMVVILIMGILMAIAVPAYLNQKKTAIDAGVASDVRGMADQIEATLSSFPNAKCVNLTSSTPVASGAKAYYTLALYPDYNVTSKNCAGTVIAGSQTSIYLSDKTTRITMSSRDPYSVDGYSFKGTNANGKVSKSPGYTFIANKGGLQ